MGCSARLWPSRTAAPSARRISSATTRRRRFASMRRANELLNASISPPSLRSASREMGEQLLSLAATWAWSAAGVESLQANGHDRHDWHHPVVFGMLGALADAAAVETLGVYLH